MSSLLANPYWSALCTEQAGFSIGNEQAKRFQPDVIPFAGIAANDAACVAALHDLLAPGEAVYVTSEASLVPHPGLREVQILPGLQMVCEPAEIAEESRVSTSKEIVPLHEADVPAMLALKALAFPGYFGPRAASLGSFYGIRPEGELIAMAGERLALPGLREISAVCTHPAHTGKGYAGALIRHVMARQQRAGMQPFLSVTASNTSAIALYQRLGFVQSRGLTFRLMQREV